VATPRGLPPDIAAAFDQVPAAGERFAALPAQRQEEWLAWLDRAESGRDRQQRLDELIRRLGPSGVATEEEVAPPPRPRPWWPWLLLLLLLVVGGLIAWWLLTRGNDKTTVPNVIGLQQQVAETRIHDANLKVLTAQGASDRPPGIVFAEKPGAGTQLDEGQTVTITISNGPARSSVPDVRGKQEQAAVDQLTGLGFKPTVKLAASSKQKGIVVSQAPAPGVTAERGATVTLVVSSGQKPVVVPAVVGLDQNAAVQKLTAANLVPQIHNASSTKPKGTVFGQKPPAGTEVDKSSKVTINVSSGSGGGTTPTGTTPTGTTSTGTAPTGTTTTASGSVRAPDVNGLAVTSGARRLNASGLRPTLKYVDSTENAGIVVDQSPSGGTTQRRGSRVQLSISNGPEPAAPVDVPNVVHKAQSTAAETIRQAGLRVLVLFRKTTKAGEVGLVLEQQPSAGTSIPGGSRVAIVVGSRSGRI
jgi:eukaryotic-like serine/threonine-protein kinase